MALASFAPHLHIAIMPDTKLSTGWLVLVSMPSGAGGVPTLSAYIVAIADKGDAVRQVRKEIGASPDTQVKAKYSLPTIELVRHDMTAGEVREYGRTSIKALRL